MSWRDLKVEKKLYCGFGIVLLLALATGWIGYNGLDTASRRSDNVSGGLTAKFYAQELATQRRDFTATGEEKYADAISRKCDELVEHLEQWKQG
jgi:hypothetical protein